MLNQKVGSWAAELILSWGRMGGLNHMICTITLQKNTLLRDYTVWAPFHDMTGICFICRQENVGSWFFFPFRKAGEKILDLCMLSSLRTQVAVSVGTLKPTPVVAWGCSWRALRTCKSVGMGKGNFSWHPYHYISHACLVFKRLIQRKHQFWCPAGLESVRHAVSPWEVWKKEAMVSVV